MDLLKICLFSFSVIYFVGCVPQYSNYKYMVFSGDGIAVLKKGQAKLEGLSGHGEMVTGYMLSRDSYKIKLNVDLNSFWPSVFLIAEIDDGSVLLEDDNRSQCGGFYYFPYRNKFEGRKIELRYEWSPPFLCANASPSKSDQVNSIKVYREGKLIGNDLIKFELDLN
jgi:hypothetical protein